MRQIIEYIEKNNISNITCHHCADIIDVRDVFQNVSYFTRCGCKKTRCIHYDNILKIELSIYLDIRYRVTISLFAKQNAVQQNIEIGKFWSTKKIAEYNYNIFSDINNYETMINEIETVLTFQ